MKKNPKFCLVFQPVYSPWVNHIERLWHKLHETITRNHQCRGMANLLARVKHFMDTVSPFPGMAMAQRRCSTIGISYLDKKSTKTLKIKIIKIKSSDKRMDKVYFKLQTTTIF